jgi:hypothetical protein
LESQATLQACTAISIVIIVIISEIFGFSSELARQMLGTPKITTEVTEPINE